MLKDKNWIEYRGNNNTKTDVLSVAIPLFVQRIIKNLV
jgi:hypothetical protein